MRRKKFAIFLAVSSFLIAVACVSGPQITPCVLDPARGVSYCAPAGGGEATELPIPKMDNYTCYSPEDMQVLLEWVKRHQKKLERMNEEVAR